MQLGLLVQAEEIFNRVLATPGAGKLALMCAAYYKARLFLEWKRIHEALEITVALAKDAQAARDHVMIWCARVLTADISSALGKLDEADAVLDQIDESKAFLPFLRARFLSVRADVRRRQGRAEEAVALAAESVVTGQVGPRYGYGEEPLRLRHAMALQAAGRMDEARHIICEDRQDLLNCAAKIPDETVRRAYLENIAAHARTLELAREWLCE